MTVFRVLHYDQSDYESQTITHLGTFSTREKAEEAKKAALATGDYKEDELSPLLGSHELYFEIAEISVDVTQDERL